MTENERILFEQYINFKMMEFEEGIMYLNYFLNSRDFQNPLGKTDEFITTQLVMFSLSKRKESIHISGAYTIINEGEHENRSFEGEIYNEKGKVIFDINYFRHNDSLEEEAKPYNVCEMFSLNRDKTTYKRFSSYKSVDGLQNYLEPKHNMSEEELKELIKQKTTVSKSK